MPGKYSKRKGYKARIKEPADNSRFGSDHTGEDYTPDEIEFMTAMERFRRERHCPFPTCCEVLAVLKSLGYRKEIP